LAVGVRLSIVLASRPLAVVLAVLATGLLKMTTTGVIGELSAELSLMLLAALSGRSLAESLKMWWAELWATLSTGLIAGWPRALLMMLVTGLSKRLRIGQL
jgi:hypothetical protein